MSKKVITKLLWTLAVNVVAMLCVIAMYKFPEQLSFLGETRALYYSQNAAPWSIVIPFLPVFIVPFIWFGELLTKGVITDWYRRILVVLLVLSEAAICLTFTVYFYYKF